MIDQHAYEFIEKHKDFAKQFQTYDEMCDDLGTLGELYKKYRWLEGIWKLLRFRDIFVCHPIVYPMVVDIRDLFKNVRLTLQHRHEGSERPHYIGGSGSVHGHYGGARSWTEPDSEGNRTRRHMRSLWKCCYGKWIHQDLSFETDLRTSFELIKREDGILLLGRDSQYIGSTWLAMLPHDQTIHKCLPQEDLDFIEAERLADEKAWGVAL